MSDVPTLDVGEGDDSGGECGIGIPARPSLDGDGSEVSFGLKEIVLDQRGDVWRDIGFNLDELCSVPPTPAVECVPPAFPDALPATDGNGGIDNQFGAELVPLFDLAFPTFANSAHNAAEEGVGVVVLRVRGWSGEANDARVDVTFSQSVGAGSGVTPPEIEARDYQLYAPGTSTRILPSWDGNDWVWLRDDTFLFADLEQPLMRDDNAYVADNQLVVALPDRVSLVFGESSVLEIRLTDSVLVGRLEGNRLTSPSLGGRWSIIDLLSTAGGAGVCPGEPEYDLFTNQLNQVADVRSTPGSGGAGTVCDAISIGVTFEGYRVRVAGLLPGRPSSALCE